MLVITKVNGHAMLNAVRACESTMAASLDTKGQFPATTVLMMVETSSAVEGRTIHHRLRAALTDQYVSSRSLYAVSLGKRTLSASLAASVRHCEQVSKFRAGSAEW
jgi:hypothetical protein